MNVKNKIRNLLLLALLVVGSVFVLDKCTDVKVEVSNSWSIHLEDIDQGHFDDSSHVEDVSIQDVPTKGHKTKYYNFHCTASKEFVNLNGEWYKRFFSNEKHWSKYGYNGLILLDGSIDTLQPFNFDGYTTFPEISYGVAGINMISLNFAYVGGVDQELNPKDTRTCAQKSTIQDLIDLIEISDPEAIIQGHRDSPGVSKACPSFDIRAEYNL